MATLVSIKSDVKESKINNSLAHTYNLTAIISCDIKMLKVFLKNFSEFCDSLFEIELFVVIYSYEPSLHKKNILFSLYTYIVTYL